MKLPHVLVALTIFGAVCALAIPNSALTLNPQTQQRVLLHVRVTDAANNPVRDVPQQSFQVTEDGVAQKIEFFMNEDVPAYLWSVD